MTVISYLQDGEAGEDSVLNRPLRQALTALGLNPDDVTSPWLTSAGASALFATLAHSHAQSDITGLVAALAAKAATSHTHIEADITGLVTDLAGKAATSHDHAAAAIISGTLDVARIPDLSAAKIASGVLAMARLATGAPDGTKFIRDDGTLAVPAGGGGGATVLDDLTDVNAPTPTDLDVLTWDDVAGEWIPAAGGAGAGVPVGGAAGEVLAKIDGTDYNTEWIPPAAGSSHPEVFNPLEAPASPNADDDEFTTASLDADWTVVTAPGGTFTVTPDKHGTFLCLDSPGAATGNLALWRRAIGAQGDAGQVFTMVARLILSGFTITKFTDVTFSDNATFLSGNYIVFGMCESSGIHAQVYDGSLVADLTVGGASSALWFLYQRSAANSVRISISLDGTNFRRLYTGTKTWNVDYMFIRMLGAGSADTSRHMIDFVRFNDARFLQSI